FNPNNSNQIAFIREETDPSKMNIKMEICTFDFSTGQLKILADNAFYDVQWSSKGWLLYVGNDYNLYKIPATGGTPVKLTNTGPYNNHPRWSPNGTKISFYDGHGQNSPYVIIDENGQRLDTLPGGAQSWFSDSIMVSTEFNFNNSYWRLGYYNLNDESFIKKDEFYSNMSSRFINILSLYLFKDKTRMFWNSNYSIAISSNFSRTVLKKSSSSWWYDHGASLSPDEKYVIFERTDIEKINECKRYSKTGIYFMNIDGSNERELKFPE
ncbi:MAG: hypothetical protein LPK21_15130, partial [Hymenobacteraceae bacterium]|nr:hypothetical protein [Hymenobacteraceae bacterium]